MSDTAVIKAALGHIATEPLTVWPRTFTCLHNWCPEKSADCVHCDKVVHLLRGTTEKPQ